jgi:hypothetical protein
MKPMWLGWSLGVPLSKLALFSIPENLKQTKLSNKTFI